MINVWSKDNLKNCINKFLELKKIKFSIFGKPIRLVLTNLKQGPPINDILFICQARLESQRVPRKMIRPFCGTTLMDILINKIKQSKIIPLQNFYLSIHDQELIDIANKHNVNFYKNENALKVNFGKIKLLFENYSKIKKGFRGKKVIHPNKITNKDNKISVNSYIKSISSSLEVNSFARVSLV